MWNQTVELHLSSCIFVVISSVRRKVLCEVGGSCHVSSLLAASSPFVLLVFEFHMWGF